VPIRAYGFVESTPGSAIEVVAALAGGGASPAALREAARHLQRAMRGVRRVPQDPPFTLLLHSCPLGEFAPEEYHWHLEVVPQPPHLLGPERGAGIRINPVPPEVAAERYRAAMA
jgi:UDPglucose--hexose-1-phosphate uridylyltransferase